MISNTGCTETVCEEFINYKVQYCHQGNVLPEGINVTEKGNSITNPYNWTYLTSEENCGSIDYYFDGERSDGRDNEIYIFKTYGTYSVQVPQYYDGGWKNYYAKLEIEEEDESKFYRDFGQISALKPLSKLKLKGIPAGSDDRFLLEEKSYDFNDIGQKENIVYFSGTIKVRLGLSKDNETWEFSEKFHEIKMIPSDDINANNGGGNPPEPDDPIECDDLILYYDIDGNEQVFPANNRLEVAFDETLKLFFKKDDGNGGLENVPHGDLHLYNSIYLDKTNATKVEVLKQVGQWEVGRTLNFGYKVNGGFTCELAKEIYIIPSYGFKMANGGDIPQGHRLQLALNKIQQENLTMYNFLNQNVQINFDLSYNGEYDGLCNSNYNSPARTRSD